MTETTTFPSARPRRFDSLLTTTSVASPVTDNQIEEEVREKPQKLGPPKTTREYEEITDTTLFKTHSDVRAVITFFECIWPEANPSQRLCEVAACVCGSSAVRGGGRI